MLLRPEESQSPQTWYSASEAQRYHQCRQTRTVQEQLTRRCLVLAGLGCGGPPPLVLDLGCGSGLSATALREAGCYWVGVDISPDMLRLAAAPSTARLPGRADPPGGPGACWPGSSGSSEGGGDRLGADPEGGAFQGAAGGGRGGCLGLLLLDMGQGLPLRTSPPLTDLTLTLMHTGQQQQQQQEGEGEGGRLACGPAAGLPPAALLFDACLSVSALQWLLHRPLQPDRALTRLLVQLHCALRPGARAVLQVYLRGRQEADRLLAAARAAGFCAPSPDQAAAAVRSGMSCLLVDLPHPTAARKYSLAMVKAGQEGQEGHEGHEGHEGAASRHTFLPGPAPACPLAATLGGTCSLWWRAATSVNASGQAHMHQRGSGDQESDLAGSQCDLRVKREHLRHARHLLRLLQRSAQLPQAAPGLLSPYCGEEEEVPPNKESSSRESNQRPMHDTEPRYDRDAGGHCNERKGSGRRPGPAHRKLAAASQPRQKRLQQPGHQGEGLGGAAQQGQAWDESKGQHPGPPCEPAAAAAGGSASHPPVVLLRQVLGVQQPAPGTRNPGRGHGREGQGHVGAGAWSFSAHVADNRLCACGGSTTVHLLLCAPPPAPLYLAAGEVAEAEAGEVVPSATRQRREQPGGKARGGGGGLEERQGQGGQAEEVTSAVQAACLDFLCEALRVTPQQVQVASLLPWCPSSDADRDQWPLQWQHHPGHSASQLGQVTGNGTPPTMETQLRPRQSMPSDKYIGARLSHHGEPLSLKLGCGADASRARADALAVVGTAALLPPTPFPPYNVLHQVWHANCRHEAPAHTTLPPCPSATTPAMLPPCPSATANAAALHGEEERQAARAAGSSLAGRGGEMTESRCNLPATLNLCAARVAHVVQAAVRARQSLVALHLTLALSPVSVETACAELLLGCFGSCTHTSQAEQIQTLRAELLRCT